MATQVFNDDMMNLIATDFQRRYEPNFAWSNAMSMYLQLPGLVGLYIGQNGTTSGANDFRDASGAGAHLNLGITTTERADSTGLRRWWVFNGSTQWRGRADSAFNSIQGNEGGIHSTIRGLTVMAWLSPNTAAGSTETVCGKWNTGGNQRSWILRRGSSGFGNFTVSGNGTTQVTATTSDTIDQDEWRFVAGRFTPSAEVKIWEGFTDGLAADNNTTSVPATIFDSTSRFAIGAINTSGTAANFWSGSLTLIAVCRAALPDLFIDSIFDLTRPLFIRR